MNHKACDYKSVLPAHPLQLLAEYLDDYLAIFELGNQLIVGFPLTPHIVASEIG